MIININTFNLKVLRSLRPQLISVLDRLIVSSDSKNWFATNDLNMLKRISVKLIDELLYSILHNRKAGFSRFKDKVNWVIHNLLLREPDNNIVRQFRIPKFMFKLVNLISKYNGPRSFTAMDF